ncbi:hypothetical protein WG66_015934 [Moniliophthora roreri]|nr:hypothetical protein WG66_015934 [Moniliophthora roreri]
MPATGRPRTSTGGTVMDFRVSPWVSYEPPPSSESSSGIMSLDAPRNENNGEIPFTAPEWEALLVLGGRFERQDAPQKEQDIEEPPHHDEPRVQVAPDPIPTDSVAESSSATSRRGNRKRKSADLPFQSEFAASFYSAGSYTPQDEPMDIDESASSKKKQRRTLARKGKGKAVDVADDDYEIPQPLPDASMSEKRKGKMAEQQAPDVPRSKSGLPKIKLLLPQRDQDGTTTAASSPIASSAKMGSAEPDTGTEPDVADEDEPQANAMTPQEEEITLENLGPVPVYPLPTKPFPVLPPPKVSTAFAPLIPLDKSKAKVRHWRVANREIRGIAGGRWFTRAWVGEKQSKFADSERLKATSAKADVKDAGKKDAGGGASASSSAPARAPPRKKKATAANSASTTRSGSQVPDGASARVPSKLRVSQVPASIEHEKMDVDMEES